MTTSVPDFKQIGWALACQIEAAYSSEEHAGRVVAASIAEQLRIVWNLRGAADAENYALLLRERDKLLEAARRAIGVIGSLPDIGIKIEAEKAYLALREAITNAEAE